MKFKLDYFVTHSRVIQDDGGRTFKICGLNDSKCACIILERPAKTKNAALLQLFHVVKVPF
jgi:hypothetical protein